MRRMSILLQRAFSHEIDFIDIQKKKLIFFFNYLLLKSFKFIRINFQPNRYLTQYIFELTVFNQHSTENVDIGRSN